MALDVCQSTINVCALLPARGPGTMHTPAILLLQPTRQLQPDGCTAGGAWQECAGIVTRCPSAPVGKHAMCTVHTHESVVWLFSE